MLTLITLITLISTPDAFEANHQPETLLQTINEAQINTHPTLKGKQTPQDAPDEPKPRSEPDSAPAPPTTAGTEQWRSLVTEFFGDLGPAEVDRALCLMGYESGGDPTAYNSKYGATGLMQVLKSWADNFGLVPADLFDPRHNLNVARALYNDNGWRHWAPYLRGLCH